MIATIVTETHVPNLHQNSVGWGGLTKITERQDAECQDASLLTLLSNLFR